MLKIQIIVAALIALLWTTHPTVLAIAAYLTLPSFEDLPPQASIGPDQDRFLLSRKVQLHFLKYRIYIPFEDITFSSESLDNSAAKSQSNLNNMILNCDFSKHLIWVPFRFKVPVIGERVLQWCLKIPLEKPS